MYIREATEEDYQEVRQKGQKIVNDIISGFSIVNFIDYSKYLNELRKEFLQLEFIQKNYGLSVDKKEK